MLRKFREGSIRWQIVTLAVLPVLLVGTLGILTEPLFSEDIEPSRAEVLSAKIDLLADQVEHASSTQVVLAILEATRQAGLDVTLEDRGINRVEQVHGDFEEPLLSALNEIHNRTAWPVMSSDGIPRIVVDVGRYPLLIRLPAEGPLTTLNENAVNILLYVLLITAPIILLSLYAAHLIAAPLAKLSAAALNQSTIGPEFSTFDESGPRELRHLARQLNEMQRHVNVMLTERTTMLRSVSHDLRTPLTRLKLRVERSVSPQIADVLIKDIDAINEMIDETLDYLRNDSKTKPMKKSDLPSLLKTICSKYSDDGFSVTYSGPARLSFECRPKMLSRAISNLIDNAVKFADQVEVMLMALSGGGVRLEVSDNGPGIPPHLLDKVVEPFVKADPARSSIQNVGFGLGLSIAQEIVKGHGGQLSLLLREPTGLTVIIELPLSSH